MRQINSELTVDELKVEIFESRSLMGAAAAGDVCDRIKELLREREFVNIIFAAAPSQNEFLEALSNSKDVDWSRVNAFHMDEYIGLGAEHPERFGNFLKRKIFDRIPFRDVYFLNNNGLEPEAEAQRYAAILEQNPADIVCMGIGENSHVAFNDPHVADFDDDFLVKIVKLDEVSRLQQVHDACFASLDEVPASAITLTVPALFNACFIYCIVPGKNKAAAVLNTLQQEVNEKFPSTIIRKHSHATLYLDRESASLLPENI